MQCHLVPPSATCPLEVLCGLIVEEIRLTHEFYPLDQGCLANDRTG